MCALEQELLWCAMGRCWCASVASVVLSFLGWGFLGGNSGGGCAHQWMVVVQLHWMVAWLAFNANWQWMGPDGGLMVATTTMDWQQMCWPGEFLVEFLILFFLQDVLLKCSTWWMEMMDGRCWSWSCFNGIGDGLSHGSMMAGDGMDGGGSLLVEVDGPLGLINMDGCGTRWSGSTSTCSRWQKKHQVAITEIFTTRMSEDNEMDNDSQELSLSSVNVSAIQRQLSAAVQAASEEPSFNLRLIEAVKQSHCLYDPSDRRRPNFVQSLEAIER
uniref:PUM-HD domain-containing protein n=1 Tax=Meloidogyne hapla TaxID=6305 RepID=A0A1I8BSR9_MELHA